MGQLGFERSWKRWNASAQTGQYSPNALFSRAPQTNINRFEASSSIPSKQVLHTFRGAQIKSDIGFIRDSRLKERVDIYTATWSKITGNPRVRQGGGAIRNSERP
jgi:hypothetical protein